MPKDVFISYARTESREYAEALYDELGEDVAFLDSEDVPVGETFPDRLLEALLDSRVVVILAEPRYFTRLYCLQEYRLALIPFLRLMERPGVQQRERDAALRGIVVALPPGDADPMLERFPASVRRVNWASVTDLPSVARLVRERRAEGLPTLRERYQALGELGTIRENVLEMSLLPAPRRIGNIPSVPLIGLPQSIHDRFVGRAKDIWRIHDVLTSERGEPSAAALTGAIEAGGGFGKTRLALEYMYRFGTRYFRGGLFWINAEQDVESQLYEVVKALDPSAPDVEVLRTGQGGVAGALARIVRSRSDGAPALFVIDNVPEPDSGEPPLPLSHWCPVLGEVAVLATSRTRVALGGPGSIVPVPIDTLEPDAAVRLLTSGAAREELTEDEWTEIAEWVGNLPLALELLNGLLTSGALSARDMLEMSREQRPSAALDAAMDVLRDKVPEGALRGVTEAFAESYERLTEPEQYAARLIAWMAPAVVPDAVLEAVEAAPFTGAVRATLRGRHFVTPPSANSAPGLPTLYGSMHRVLADFLRSHSLHPYDELDAVLHALRQVSDHKSGDERLRVVELVAPVLVALTGHTFEAALVSREPADQLDELISGVDNCIEFLRTSGAYAWAQLCSELAVQGCRRVLGEEHPWTLRAMLELAYVLWERGQHTEAQKLEEHVLEIRRRVWGEEHAATLEAMHNLAETLKAVGDLAGAQKMQERVLEARRRVLGEEHPATLTAMNNLADTLRERGDHESAREIQERVLEARRRVLGEEHPATLTTMNNLAATLWTQGDHAGAQEMLERVLAARRRAMGEEHPDTLTAMSNLAPIMRVRGDLVGAQEMQERVLEVRRRVLGEEHPATLVTANNLATTLWTRGDHVSAQEIQERVLAARHRVLGKEHPDTSLSAWNLLRMLVDMRKVSEARRVFTENLLWLLERESDTLSGDQLTIREWLPPILEELGGDAT